VSRSTPRILILGGGFGGVAVAQGLTRLLPGRDAEITLVSRDNFLLFHPMLPEVAGAEIEPGHILTPLRQMCRGARVLEGQVQEIDLDHRQVVVAYGPHATHTQLAYDYLVIAVGSVTNFSELTGMAQHAFPLKTIGDALYLHNHVVDVLEEADVEADPERRRQLLTFVVAGGGFSGVETVAELNDYVRETTHYYPNVDPSAVRMVLLHAGGRILPELGEELAAFALKHLERRGVEVRLNTRLDGATEDEAVLHGGEVLPTRSLVSTIGTSPNPIIAALPCKKDDHGRIVVDSHLELDGYPGVWALGDCAAAPNAIGPSPAPATAQFAQHEGKLVAHNVVAALRGQRQETFSYAGLGQFVSLGHRSAAAEILGRKIHGFVAWWMWRTVYLSKLPGLSRKTRVALDWTLDLIFGRDIVELPLARTHRVGRAHFEPGDVIVRAGEFGDECYVITDGEVEVVRSGADGQSRPAEHLREGDYFGEPSLLPGRPRTATVRAVSAVNVIALGREDFAIMAKHWMSLQDSLKAAAPLRDGGPAAAS
jgi:NADH dehydrogenase